MILLVDNYDSFVHNLARYFQRLGQETLVVRNDAIDAAGAWRLKPAALVLSPGPCTPERAGCSLDLVHALHERLPILGICLGHQAIAQALGARVVRAAEPMHGRTSQVYHDGRGVFAGLANPLVAGRYHSLVVEPQSLPSCLVATAHTADGAIMALAHRQRPVVGLQFHPESVLTDSGYALLANFLQLAGVGASGPLPTLAGELAPRQSAWQMPTEPVTF